MPYESRNIRLYDSRDFVLVLSDFLCCLKYHCIFDHLPRLPTHEEQNQTIGLIVRASIGYYLQSLSSKLFTISTWVFIKARRWEAMLMVFLLIDILTINLQGVELLSLLGDTIGVSSLQSGFVLLLQFYVMIIVFLEFGRLGAFA